MKKKIGSSKPIKKMGQGGINNGPGDGVIFRASSDNTRVSKVVNDGSINKAKIAEQKDAFKNAKRILKEGQESKNDSLGYFYEKLTPQQQTRLTNHKKGGTVTKVKTIKKSKKK